MNVGEKALPLIHHGGHSRRNEPDALVGGRKLRLGGDRLHGVLQLGYQPAQRLDRHAIVVWMTLESAMLFSLNYETC